MARVKKAVNALKNRRKVLKRTKGFRHGQKSKERQANEAIFHAGTYAFAHRRDKKGDFRRLWNVRLSALLKENGTSYSKFIDLLKKNNIALDRKVLSQIADQHPEAFKQILSSVKQ
jgi:large subunit ribosomal protein L20